MKIATTLVLALSLSLAACASMDKRALTSFAPGKTDGTYDYFTYVAGAASNGAYPLDSAEAEATRRQWLQEFLDDNGYKGKPYEVLSRRPVLKQKALLSDVYDVFYEVRVPSR